MTVQRKTNLYKHKVDSLLLVRALPLDFSRIQKGENYLAYTLQLFVTLPDGRQRKMSNDNIELIHTTSAN